MLEESADVWALPIATGMLVAEEFCPSDEIVQKFCKRARSAVGVQSAVDV